MEPKKTNENLKSYNVCLKDTVKTFTKRLFYSLFDCEQEVVHNEYLKDTFLKVLVYFRDRKRVIKYGKALRLNSLEIRKKLDADAIAFEKNDPASHCLKEIYLAYPGFHAISIYRLSHALHKRNVYILPRMMSRICPWYYRN